MGIGDLQDVLPAFAGGAVLGAAFFLGLRWTVARVLQSGRPLAWQLGSAVVRSAVVLAGIWLLADARWERMLAALAGFTLARLLFVRGAAGTAPARAKEAPDAPQP